MKTIKFILFFLFLFFFFSCSINEKQKFAYRGVNQKNNAQNFYTKRFRDVVFYKCLRYGYGDNLNMEIGKLMAQKDLFSPSDDDPDLKIDSIQNILAKKIMSSIPPPYIHLEDEKMLESKNFIISTCLSYYESRDLDSIAKKMYKEKVKQDKKIWGKDYK
ncbi:MAG: hypothetical protein QM564_07465 [Bergeyella sp.]